MNDTDTAIQYYNGQAVSLVEQYDGLEAALVHQSLKPLLNSIVPTQALDIGAGSGRDARWLRCLGWQVTAIEPADNLRKLALSHADNGDIRWCSCRLPALEGLSGKYDLVLLSAVWMHLPEKVRPSALTRLAALLSLQGRLVITLRHGPLERERPMYPVSVKELTTLAEPLGLQVSLLASEASDCLHRSEVVWQTVVIQHERASPVVSV